MSELASAMFSIADANEFRFARFYIVCEVVPLGTPGSPLIVCGLPDTLRECSNVEETRNQMQPIRLEEIHTFFSTNVPHAVPPEIAGHTSYNITYLFKRKWYNQSPSGFTQGQIRCSFCSYFS